MTILRELGGDFFHLKHNWFFDHFIYWQLILQFSFPSFPLDNKHSVQWIPNIWFYDTVASIIVYLQYVDNFLITSFLYIAFTENI